VTQAVADALLNGTGRPDQDYIVLSGERSPGKAIVHGLSAPRKWQENDGYALSGASLIFGGNKLCHFEVEIQLWEDDHWKQWDTFAKRLEKPPEGVRPKAQDIQHPLINRSPHKITSVVVDDVTGGDITEDGMGIYRIKLIAYKAPKPVLARIVASTPGVELKPTAQDANEVEIQRLRGKVTALGG